jgi:tetratricopeptide (TPR) repeat protein
MRPRFSKVSSTPAPPEIRYAALCAKGDNLVARANEGPEKLESAIETYKQLAAMPDVGAGWRNRAVYKHGKVLMQLGREQEALVVFNRLLDEPGAGSTETFWLYKSGFEAASILRGFGSWRGAFSIYEKLARIPGPRAAEAMEQVKELRLKKFIWD